MDLSRSFCAELNTFSAAAGGLSSLVAPSAPGHSRYGFAIRVAAFDGSELIAGGEALRGGHCNCFCTIRAANPEESLKNHQVA